MILFTFHIKCNTFHMKYKITVIKNQRVHCLPIYDLSNKIWKHEINMSTSTKN